MYNRRKAIVCYFIAFIVLFYGIYFAALETESIPNYVQADNIVSSIHVDEVSISEADIAAKEILNIRSSSSGQSIIHQFLMTRKAVKLSWSFLIINFFSYFAAKIFVAIIAMESPKPHRNMAVLSYIHNTDGKKRIWYNSYFI